MGAYLVRALQRWGLVAVLGIALGAAAGFERISVPGAIALLLFGGATIVLAGRLLDALDRGETIALESAWGGLGGGIGGWRLSPAACYLVALLVSSGLLAAAVATEVARLDADGSPEPPAATAGQDDAAPVVGGPTDGTR